MDVELQSVKRAMDVSGSMVMALVELRQQPAVGPDMIGQDAGSCQRPLTKTTELHTDRQINTTSMGQAEYDPWIGRFRRYPYIIACRNCNDFFLSAQTTICGRCKCSNIIVEKRF